MAHPDLCCAAGAQTIALRLSCGDKLFHVLWVFRLRIKGAARKAGGEHEGFHDSTLTTGAINSGAVARGGKAREKPLIQLD